MAQGSRQIQTQAQQQIQTLSPQQILVVKLLELPAIELEDRVRAELLENPALEEGKDDTSGDEYSNTPDADSNAEDGGDTDYDSLSDYLNEDDIPDYKLQENNHSKGEEAEEIPFSDTTSFYETLKEQLGRQSFADRLLHCFLRVYVYPEKRFECNGLPVGMGFMPACRMYHTELSGFPRYLSR